MHAHRFGITIALTLGFVLLQIGARPAVHLVGLIGLGTPALAQSAADTLAAQIRLQGYPCNTALRARRNAKKSRPDAAFWILTCDNAAYAIRLDPNMAAHVTKIK